MALIVILMCLQSSLLNKLSLITMQYPALYIKRKAQSVFVAFGIQKCNSFYKTKFRYSFV